ncbi:DUF4259 domain-containing protein [Corynebacterium sp. KPL1818]|uniref:DUF4259 domain-containing protein n=1 Tax=Corynebacterium sp. KPL1818 TaxID=1203559 RepID=UPI001E40E010|nr:DUF4259 domain-containing protein [Corynebacterium sp. KPL1818]
MGTWGTGPFDNHAARDVLDSLRNGSFDLRHFHARAALECSIPMKPKRSSH